MSRAPGYHRWKACASKVRFRTEYDARKSAKRRGWWAYACGYCKGRHLSSLGAR